MTEQCFFCEIIKGKISSTKVYEDDLVLGILDANPANPGHILILPKEHYPIMSAVPENIQKHMFSVAKKVSIAQLKTLQSDGTNLFIANGSAAGQKSPHFMIHIIPRKHGDGVSCFDLPKNQINPEDQQSLMQALIPKANEKYAEINNIQEQNTQVELQEPIQEKSVQPEEKIPQQQIPKNTPDKIKEDTMSKLQNELNKNWGEKSNNFDESYNNNDFVQYGDDILNNLNSEINNVKFDDEHNLSDLDNELKKLNVEEVEINQEEFDPKIFEIPPPKPLVEVDNTGDIPKLFKIK